MPFVVSDYYSPDGFFGDGETRGRVTLVRGCPNRPADAAGDCVGITYLPGAKRSAGIFWQHPHNNWGDYHGHFISEGATRITFSARGESGGESLTVGAGQKSANAVSDKFSLEEVQVALTKDWKAYELPFRGMKYDSPTGVVGAFMVRWSAKDNDDPSVFYLDDIRWAK